MEHQEVAPRLEQATVARFYSYVFQVAVIEARELYAENPEDADFDKILVDGNYQLDTQKAVLWVRQFIRGLTTALNAMRGWPMSATDVQKAVGAYCDNDPQRMERVAVGMAIQQVLEHIQQSLNQGFLEVDAAGMLADWFTAEGQTDAGVAWLMDTTAHLLVADAMPNAEAS